MRPDELLPAGLGADLHRIADAVERAEQEAARSADSLRDVLRGLVDRQLVIGCADGTRHRGVLAAVGLDHLVIDDADGPHWVALFHVVDVAAHSAG